MDGRDKYVDAEEYRKIVTSLLDDWAREEYRNTREIYRTWPRLLGHPRDHDISEFSIEEESDTITRKRKHSNEKNEEQDLKSKHLNDDDGDRDYATLMQIVQAPEDIPKLPIPDIDNVPPEVVERSIMYNRRCHLCANCIKDKGQRMIRCLTLEAARDWNAQFGFVDGETVAALAAKLGERVHGHGMRLGRGLRCGFCKTCRAASRDYLCLVTTAIREGRLPERLKPAVADIPRRKETFGSVADPLSKKPSGFEMLKQQYKDQGDSEDEEEYERWGLPNVPFDERPTVSGSMHRRQRKLNLTRWECFNRLDDSSICGSKNREGQKWCPKCRAPRWSGAHGQLRARVFDILGRGMLPACKPGELPVIIQKMIMREYAGMNEKNALDEENVPMEEIKIILHEYWTMRDMESLPKRVFEKDPVVIQAGKIVKHSALGAAIEEFDSSLMQYVEEREARVGTRHNNATHDNEDDHHYNITLLTDERRRFCDMVIQDIESILHTSLDSIPVQIEKKLTALRACLYDWSGEETWLEGMRAAWSCHIARRQFASIVKDSFIFTIKSMLAHFIHCHTRMMRGDSLGEGACAVCSVNHSIFLPPWRADPRLVKLSDRIHDVTPRVMDEEDSKIDTREYSHVEAVHQQLRYPVYRLVEQTLNETSLKDASERIPFVMRPFPATKFIESTKLSSFPALPVSKTDWYNSSIEMYDDNPSVARCIPDGKKRPQEFLADIVGMKGVRRKIPKKANGIKPQAIAFSPYTEESQTAPQISDDSVMTEEECERISKKFPADVKLVLKAAQSLGVSVSLRYRTIKHLYALLHE